MLKSRQYYLRASGFAALLLGEHKVLDLDNAGHCIFGVTKKFHAHRTGVLRHTMHDPAGAGDQAVAAFFLNAGQAAQKLVGHVFAQAFFTEGFAGYVERLGASVRFAVGFKILQLERGHVGIVNLAEVVVHARDL